MTSSLESLAYLIIVAIFWGTTNPFLKKGASGIENVKAATSFHRLLKQIAFLATNFKYMVPFLVNQCGSLLFVFTLGHSDLSLAIPVTNSLTFVFTAIFGRLLGEEKASKGTYFGALLILIGTSLCCLDKLSTA